MANQSKESKLKQRFVVDLVSEKKYKASSLPDAFSRCWAQVPAGLKSKLNTEELWKYLKTHVIPYTTIPLDLPTSRNAYAPDKVSNRKGFEALV